MKVKKLKNMEKLKFNVLVVVAACKDFFMFSNGVSRGLKSVQGSPHAASASVSTVSLKTFSSTPASLYDAGMPRSALS